jgi:carboxypeptidase C (cathepsin A)
VGVLTPFFFMWQVSSWFLCLLLGSGESELSPSDYQLHGFGDYGIHDELYGGYMPIDLHKNHEGNFFFLLTKQRPQRKDIQTKEKLIIWLNGGPGCTSLLGAFYENGPFTLKGMHNSTYDLESNPSSWNEVAHTIFVEQPIRSVSLCLITFSSLHFRTGFSQASTDAKKTRNEAQIAFDFRGFLSSFLEVPLSVSRSLSPSLISHPFKGFL